MEEKKNKKMSYTLYHTHKLCGLWLTNFERWRKYKNEKKSIFEKDEVGREEGGKQLPNKRRMLCVLKNISCDLVRIWEFPLQTNKNE